MATFYEDPYQILGLSRQADKSAIKRAYFRLVRQYPPERNPEMFKRIRAAYEALRDSAKRQESDMRLLQDWQARPQKQALEEPDLRIHKEDIIAAAHALSDLRRNDWRELFQAIRFDTTQK
jgi:DnaJ-class molecular chaperone with C-terminal Zn finger domain